MVQQQFLRERERGREMAKAGDFISAKSINPLPIPYPAHDPKSSKLLFKTNQIKASSRINDFSLIAKKGSKAPRRLITISTSNDRWHGKWICDYILSLQELRLDDLVEDEQRDAKVTISLCIQKHAGFGLSVEGKIITSFTRKCSCCYSPYCREIDTNFNVWVLPSSRDDNSTVRLPEIGGDDPSVIYVKPGQEANLDTLIQDSIRLTISVKDTCSELCENSEPTVQYIGGRNAAPIDGRWSRLLELKKAKSHNS